jgi:hypothetical protein
MRSKTLLSVALITVLAGPVSAGGGNAIGKVANDLSQWFNSAAKPTPPLRTPELQNTFDPPEIVPGGSTQFSTGQVREASPPGQSLLSVFQREAADAPTSNSLSNVFNFRARGN